MSKEEYVAPAVACYEELQVLNQLDNFTIIRNSLSASGGI